MIAKWLIALVLAVDFTKLPNRPEVPLRVDGSWLQTAYMGAAGNQNTVAVGKTLKLHVVGVYTDGTTHDMDNKYVFWFLDPRPEKTTPGAVEFDQEGNITGRKPGRADINASMRIKGDAHPIFSNAWTVYVTKSENVGDTDE